ncbi:hypothetical protein GYMLUDRAFT_247529 [Collybiopsis luxurians FD-317 M1]|uniref:Uncharacterized protein n=1 Tax=Collybiopsis luxurians FD-317 M1 TaxID=944289 RepID=A0A0D0CNA8_9AGAR|nr:hypothetical protein GYMLUDRAFT_247529 [Collybiopsis luxurians FD-317 M1]
MNYYTGFLGSDAARFPGQDSCDIYLQAPDGDVRLRQRVYCMRQGISLAFYERSQDGGRTWTHDPGLINRIEWENMGVTNPFDVSVSPTHPPINPGVQVPGLMMIAGDIVLCFRLPWYYKVQVQQFADIAPDNDEDWEQIPLFYHEHYPRASHTDLDTPQYKPDSTRHKFWCLQYGDEVHDAQVFTFVTAHT